MKIPSNDELEAKSGQLDFYDNPDGASEFIKELLGYVKELRTPRKGLFGRKKWELVEEDKRMISKDVLFGTPDRHVVCDVYRLMGKDGIYKYKYEPRY